MRLPRLESCQPALSFSKVFFVCECTVYIVETSFAFFVSCFVLTKEAMALHYLVTFVTFYKIVEIKMGGSIVKDLNPVVKRVDLIRTTCEEFSIEQFIFSASCSCL